MGGRLHPVLKIVVERGERPGHRRHFAGERPRPS